MEILDCTLRDGGYYTNWDFPEKLLVRYFSAMESLPISTIEIGYRNNPGNTYFGKHYYTPISLIETARKLMPSKKLCLMLNEKDCPAEQVEGLIKNTKGIVNLFRIAVAPARLQRALELAKIIRANGFEVGINLMYVSTLSTDSPVFEAFQNIEKVADVLSLVDSYGGIYPDQLEGILTNCRKYSNITLGFHGHNNVELAFANSIVAMQQGCEVIDATMTGMGRGAGNLKTELLLTHLANHAHTPVNFNILGDLVNEFEKLWEIYSWGTNLPYMVSGMNSLPQKDVMDWVSKRYFSVQSIVRALNNQKEGNEDNLKFPEFIPHHSIEKALIVGGGASVKEHLDAILILVNRNPDVCVIHASSKNAALFANIKNKQYYCLVGNEGQRLEEAFNKLGNWNGDCILPPYPRKMGTYVPITAHDRTFELPTSDVKLKYDDSHTSLAIQTAMVLNVKELYVIGYDGYGNHMLTNREQELIEENNYLFHYASTHFAILRALTATKYDIPDRASVYQYIS